MNQKSTCHLSAEPPNNSVAFTENVMREFFAIDGEAQELACARDQIFALSANDGERYILRFTNPAEESAITNFQTEALLHVARVAPSLPMPHIIRSVAGETDVAVVMEDGRTSMARVINFLPGIPLSQVPQRAASIRSAMAATLAELGFAFRGFFHCAAGHEVPWDLKHAASLRGLLHHIQDDETRQLATQGLDDFELYAKPQEEKLRCQVIHNDLNFSNVMIDEQQDQICGIIDFGDMVHAPLIYDVAVALAYHLSGDDEDTLAIMVDFVSAYHRVVPLEEEELAILYDLVVMRQVMTLTITERRATLHPENRKYILRNHPVALKAIRRLAKIDRNKAAQAFFQACPGYITHSVGS